MSETIDVLSQPKVGKSVVGVNEDLLTRLTKLIFGEKARFWPGEDQTDMPPERLLGGKDAEIWSEEDLKAKQARDWVRQEVNKPFTEKLIRGANPEAQTFGAATEGAVLGGLGPVSAAAMSAFTPEAPRLESLPLPASMNSMVPESSTPGWMRGPASIRRGGSGPIDPNSTRRRGRASAPAPEPEVYEGTSEFNLPGLTQNASAESGSGGSAEALSRAAGMRAQGKRFVIVDRAGNVRPSTEDVPRLSPNEAWGILDASGNFQAMEGASGVRPRAAMPAAVVKQSAPVEEAFEIDASSTPSLEAAVAEALRRMKEGK